MGLLAVSCCFLMLASVQGLAVVRENEASSQCGGQLVVEDEVTLSSPNFPSRYGKKEHCSWKLVSKDANSKLEVHCPKFDLQPSKECKKDRLLIVQGNKEVQRFCGQGPKKFTADSSELEIVFRSNRWASKTGFECNVRSLYFDSTTEGSWTTTKAPVTKPPTKPPGGSNGKCECGVPNLTRIVNGDTVKPAHKYPWQVGLKKRDEASYWCGGTIINNKYALTAAHCFFDKSGNRASDEGLVVGVADHNMSSDTDDVKGVTRLVDVEKVIIHSSYNPKGNNDYDMALLRLKETLDLSKNKQLRAVCLPKDDSKTYAGMKGVATGWGNLKTDGKQPDELQEVVLPILDTKCWDLGATERMVCAGYKDGSKDTCQGDSGGPLYVKESTKLVQVGVTSFGFGNCADPGKPGAYARVSKFLEWIKQNTADATYCM